MAENNLCRDCKTEMKVIRTETVKGIKYKILRCEKCSHQIARAER